MQKQEIWLLVGREFEGSSVRHYFVKSNNGVCKQLTYKQFVGFANQHNVINARVSGQGGLKGVGIDLNLMPKYKRVNGQLMQYGGVQEAEVIRLAQPLIQKLYEKSQQEIMRRQAELEKREQAGIRKQQERERVIIRRQTEEERRALARQKEQEKRALAQQKE